MMRYLIFLTMLILAACQPAALPETDLPAGTMPAATAAPVETTQVTETLPPTEDGSTIPETGVQVPEDWQTLTEETFGYSVAFPQEWEPCTETRYSHVYCEVQIEPSGLGPPPRLYISVIPEGNTNADFEIYNYLPIETIREFISLPVGESRLKEPGAITPEYFTYTRLPDQEIAGLPAAVIENTKVWEAPPGTRDRLYLIDTEGAAYLIGTYYQTPEQLEMMGKVMDSFQFTP